MFNINRRPSTDPEIQRQHFQNSLKTMFWQQKTRKVVPYVGTVMDFDEKGAQREIYLRIIFTSSN